VEVASRHVLNERGAGRKVDPAASRRSREALPLRRDKPILPTILRPACFAVWPPHGPRTYAIRCTDCRTCPVRKEPPIRSRFLLDDPRWFTCAPARACYGLSLFPVWTSGRRRRVWTSQGECPRNSARGWLPHLAVALLGAVPGLAVAAPLKFPSSARTCSMRIIPSRISRSPEAASGLRCSEASSGR
jgi:hypothetical protein